MTRSIYLTAIILLSSVTLISAQSSVFNIKGIIIDSAKKNPIVLATVYVKNRNDSTLLGYALTNSKGEFEISDIPIDSAVRLRVFYTGYSTYSTWINKYSSPMIDLGEIPISMEIHQLSTLTVNATGPPIAIKGDTIEFNAASFKTRPNSVLSDLLKRLPGVEVDKNGKIIANGKPVDKILLDGKAFFGNDYRIALQNLSSAIIDKVQITDTKTFAEEVSGQPASGRSKTINLTLKKGLDHGYFGRAYAGYGSNRYYDGSGLINYFKGKERISVLGASNNINEIGFTPKEAADMLGPNSQIFVNSNTGSINSAGMSFGGRSGLNRSTIGGLDYGNDIGKHISLNGSYFYGNLDNRKDLKTFRQNILPDSIVYYNSDSKSGYSNPSNRISANVEFKSPYWRINLEPYIGVTENHGSIQNNAISSGPSGNLINRSNSQYTSDGKTKHLENILNVSRSFRNKGQYLLLYLNTNNTSNEESDYNKYYNIFNNSGTTDSVNQNISITSKRNDYEGTLAYVRHLTSKVTLLLNYGLTVQKDLTDKKTMNYDSIRKRYISYDSTYSNNFRSNIILQTPSLGASFKIDSGKWYFEVISNLNFIGLHHHSYSDNLSFDQDQFYIVPQITIRHHFKNRASLTGNYYTSIQQPSIEQLLPITNNTNPLYQTRGNPGLKPSLIKNTTIAYELYDFKSGNNLSLSLAYQTVNNAIANVTTYDEQLRQFNTFTNVNNNNQWSSNVSLSKLKKSKYQSLEIKISANASLYNSHNFIDTIKYINQNYNLAVKPSVDYQYRDLFEVAPSYQINFQYYRYHTAALTSQRNIMFKAGLSATLYWPAILTWNSDLNYVHNSDVIPGYRRGYWLWNASVGLNFIKQKRATLEFSIFDVLNQNNNAHRRVMDTYIEDTQTSVLHQFFMIKLIYNIRKPQRKKEALHRQIYIF